MNPLAEFNALPEGGNFKKIARDVNSDSKKAGRKA